MRVVNIRLAMRVAGLLAVIALAGCSANRAPAVHGAPVAFTSIDRSSVNPRQLLVPVLEPTMNYRDFCSTYYRATATETETQIRVTLIDTTPPSSGESACDTSPRPHYVPVALPNPFAGQSVTDTTSGLKVRVGPMEAPSERSLVRAK
jgi:hypothetical protein